MVDSSRLPPSQVTKPATPATVLGDQSARAVRLPDALTVLSRAVRVEGDVVRQNTDGTVRVNTPQGDMDIQVRGKQPQPGQRLEVDIPAGRPPRQITIRPAPQPAQTQPDIQVQPRPAPATPAPATPIATRPSAPSPSPAPVSQAPAQQIQTPPRPGVTPQPLPPEQTAARPAPQPAPLPPGTPVRFMPTTPAQAQQMVQATTQAMTMLPTTATRAAFTANLIAQGAQDANTQALQTLMQARPADIAAMAQQVRSVPALPLAQPGTGAAATPFTNILQQILNMPQPTATQPTGYTQPTPGAGATPATIIPATGPSAPVATLIAFTPGMEMNPAAMSLTRMPAIAQMDARILSIQPPGMTPLSTAVTPQGLPTPGVATVTPPAMAPQAPAGSVTGVVTGFTPQNLPLVTLQWPGSGLPQTFVLQFNAANLQVGSTITLQPQNVQIGAPGAQPGAAPVSPQMAQLLALFGPGPWPVMDEAYQTLLQASPQLAQAFARALPSPGNPSQLGAAALLFIAAVRSGDIGGWLGDKKVDALKAAGKNNLLARLTQDLATLPGRAAESPALSGEWRPVPLPMFYDGQIQKIALYVKQDGERSASEDKDKTGQTRFIFDLDLDRMGGVQLDGLVRDKRFDLVVRTQIPLSEPMRQAMKQSYSNALQDTELHGDLSFQGDMKNWVNVLQKEAAFGASA